MTKSPPIKPAPKEYVISIDESPDGKAGLLVEKAEDGTMTVLAEKYTPAPSSTGEKEYHPVYKSDCCKVGVYLKGQGEYSHYRCNKCDKYCDFIVPTPTNSATDNSSEDWEDKFDSLFETHDEDGNYNTMVIEYRRDVKEFIKSLLSNNRKQIIQEVREGLGKTWGGSASGYHGYQTLPDCKEKKHNVTECADCYLDSLEEGDRP